MVFALLTSRVYHTEMSLSINGKQLLEVEKQMKFALTNNRNEKQQSETNQYDFSLIIF